MEFLLGYLAFSGGCYAFSGVCALGALKKLKNQGYKEIKKRTTQVEARYHSFELETLAIIYSLCRFRIYLEGIECRIFTDCNT